MMTRFVFGRTRAGALAVALAALPGAAPAQDIRTLPGAQQPAQQQPPSRSYGPPTPIDVQLRDTPPPEPPQRTAPAPAPVVAPVERTVTPAPAQPSTERAGRRPAAAPVARPQAAQEAPVERAPAPTIPLPTGSANPAPVLPLPSGTAPAPSFDPAPVGEAAPADAAAARPGWMSYWPWIAGGVAVLLALGWLLFGRRKGEEKGYAPTVPAPVEEQPLGYVPPAAPRPAPQPAPQPASLPQARPRAAPAAVPVAADGRITSRLRSPEAEVASRPAATPAAPAKAADGRIVSSRLKAPPAPRPAPPPRGPAGYQVRSASVGYGIIKPDE